MRCAELRSALKQERLVMGPPARSAPPVEPHSLHNQSGCALLELGER